MATIVSLGVTFYTLLYNPSKWSINSRRKYFHGLALVLFFPCMLLDLEFTHLAFSVGQSALILLELLRLFQLEPIGDSLGNFIHQFTNERDQGRLVLSHIYLLMGTALPVWLTSLVNHKYSGWIPYNGLVLLGISDSLASIIGKQWGKHYWPNTSKTMEGSLAFYVSSCVLLMGVECKGVLEWVGLHVILISIALMEAFIQQNDNLILPLFATSALLLQTI